MSWFLSFSLSNPCGDFDAAGFTFARFLMGSAMQSINALHRRLPKEIPRSEAGGLANGTVGLEVQANQVICK